MAQLHQQPQPLQPEYLEDDIYEDQTDDESLASLETDDGQDHPPEKILAQSIGKNGFIWYLVKWQDCPVIRSSWEGIDLFSSCPGILDAWKVEQKRQADGLSKPLDLAAFQRAQQHLFHQEIPQLFPTSGAMIFSTSRCLLCAACLVLPILAQNAPSTPSESPPASNEVICPAETPGECYPRTFVPTENFQIIREGQDIPPGLHVRMNINTGLKEARLNIPIEGETTAEELLEGLPVEQSMVVVEQPEEDPIAEPERTALRDQVPMNPPAFDSAGKIMPPMENPESPNEMGTFQTALLTIKMEARAFDKALDDLMELSHDIYYGVEIAKDGPVLEKLLCLALGAGTERMKSGENGRDHKAAAIIVSAIQNNPTALKEIKGFQKMVMYPTCGESKQSDFVSILRTRLGGETNPALLKTKVGAISGLLKEPSFRDEFIEKGGMELVLAMWLKEGPHFDVVKKKVAQLIMDNFLDEGMGASLGKWPRTARSSVESCKAKDTMLADGCWEHHIQQHTKYSPDDTWANEFFLALRIERAKIPVPDTNREL
ncbi:hypothetical protein HYFRA_00012698 [Hymenoscyphus fraxineus]|uniref:Nucleotide exchange factor SIL1 n=1 Tax=Hymenoscyphus fraxineus TaxID=746836 RepID=A0A9N9L4N3_9HELO|nr:hypothetical protein HYFRA_00012698 [Hymenoscyphus fraxineus]